MSVNVHHRDDDDHSGPDPKRTKLTEDTDDPDIIVPEPDHPTDDDNLLPPSHALLGLPKQHYPDGVLRIMENDVGISEYIASDLPQIHGIIKQRFTDFLVFEVDLDGNEIHLKDIGPPDTPTNNQNSDAPTETPTEPAPITPDTLMEDVQSTVPTASEDSASKDSEPWPDSFTARLQPYFSPSKLDDLKKMYLEGPEPPFVSDSGWAGRQPKADGETAEGVGEKEEQKDAVEEREPGRGRRGRGRGRGGRGRGGGRPRPGERPDNRRVISDPIPSKQIRTELHQAVRELFRGKLDTETDTTNPDSAAIVVRWNKQPLGRSNRDPKHPAPSSSRGNYPPYIHFTLQKTSRDTQDALAHLARLLHVPLNHLAVAGTKDKRGVTVQRVSLKRDGKDVMAVWAAVNALHREGRTAEDAVRERGERGVRIADLSYKRQGLELGNLKGNAFVITLRNVHAASPPTLDRALSSLRTRGFVNYYGMQRFGTASIPTHAIGLALLQGAWQKAVSMILRERPGEHPDVVAARRAWLVDGDLAGALERMPRRVVAERCILESYRKMKGDTRNAFGALQTIPKNLRLMYVHAYQSYLWNAIVSERIRMYGAEKPVVGDLVLDTEESGKEGDVAVDAIEEVAPAGADEGAVPAEANEDAAPAEEANGEEAKDTSIKEKKPRKKREWKGKKRQRVKTLTEADVDNYSIFDVIMPLPGKDVAYPGGPLGERYKEFVRADGLDPDNWVRKQKEYSLGGSYRKILHLPSALSYSVLRYTDPDVPLAQADEDRLLGFDTPAVVADGRFTALQVKLTLGTAAYATMALREVTRTETSSHYQTALTAASEDQKYRGGVEGEEGEEVEVKELLES